MAYVIGIDTGGTYTDAVLLKTDGDCGRGVVRKAKALTTHEKLENGISESIYKLRLTAQETSEVERVVLSTTLATNAIVESKTGKVGVIIIGERPWGVLASEKMMHVDGEVNIKGRVLSNVRSEQVRSLLDDFLPGLDAVAISGASSIRNPEQELQVKSLVQEKTDIPVMCGHEIANVLGYLERTNTVILNAGLLPIIHGFIKAMETSLKKYHISAPVFVMKGDGSIASLAFIKEKPIETVLSGPAASMTGAVNLAQIETAIVSDMGGTTTDVGVIRNKRVELSHGGALVGPWKIQIRSAKLHTFGLGGDSNIAYEDGKIIIGPERVLPACRGGIDTITPTDILHYTEEYVLWDRDKSIKSIAGLADRIGIPKDELVKKLEEAVVRKVLDVLGAHESLPVCAVGAPARTWYEKAREESGLDAVIPEHHEVANAVGAATAGIRETVEATVRPGEEGRGYLAHTKTGRYFSSFRKDALQRAVDISCSYAKEVIYRQNLELAELSVICEDVFEHNGKLIYEFLNVSEKGVLLSECKDGERHFIETVVRVTAQGKIFED
ncbi:hydantoinase/oxoprolinase family protein [Lactonifactor sp. BIOML-A3]|uniref:hydantoinase/oxoprolinase family protein n=1 Tax=Lactonifactor TaxID=420345 RepID=UPI0012AF2BA3|nr:MULTISPECIES: hydantoinase/oxoprolinase family protein [Lactonifactor]MCB5713847.1 hydantoinase/oxoprolinase family protein [Lactonifactor longoviformis]MCB5717869.1 hydantoinase/oxoprolinase family protein [Lactonifactor longoviformis]MSA01608.1 hydantoinase/oxoprolinase family protein [Lactonifactor sp. BIOML-A5]MSA07836.1 hydantoinase/oxoprolinase family protein [Lactonifactor sp. BIOML-A4]MSA12453.1 hydantoinase/oxoprolinase family protein [Lactonifactor sp. BIOML-A3]